MIYKSDEELQQACAEWQKILRLQDWMVKTFIHRANDMEEKDHQGECDPRLKTKIAVIRIRDPIDYPDNLVLEQDMELTLVHELLHLHFAPIYANTEDQSIDDAQETAIDCIAHALVNLHRKGRIIDGDC